MKAAATLLKAVVLLFSNACEEIVHYSLSEPKHICAFMLLWYLVHGAENLLRRHLPAAGGFYAGEFILSRILAAADARLHCGSAVCGGGEGRRLPYTSSQVFGVVEKIPGCLQSYLQLERALWFASTKPQMFANTAMGLFWHVGWMKGLSATSIHNLNISLFSPCLPSPVKLQWEEFIFIFNTLDFSSFFFFFPLIFLAHKMKLCSWIVQ